MAMLSRLKFSIRTLFVAVVIVSIVAWGLSSPGLKTILSFVFAAGLTGGYVGHVRHREPQVYGIIGATAAVLLMIAALWTVHIVGYFFHRERWPYFEDGFVTEVFFYPIVYFVVYGIIGAVIGFIAGSAIHFFKLAWDRIDRNR